MTKHIFACFFAFGHVFVSFYVLQPTHAYTALTTIICSNGEVVQGAQNPSNTAHNGKMLVCICWTDMLLIVIICCRIQNCCLQVFIELLNNHSQHYEATLATYILFLCSLFHATRHKQTSCNAVSNASAAVVVECCCYSVIALSAAFDAKFDSKSRDCYFLH